MTMRPAFPASFSKMLYSFAVSGIRRPSLITSALALFLLLNVILFFSVLIWAWQTSEAAEPPISAICDSITPDGTGHLTAAGPSKWA